MKEIGREVIAGTACGELELMRWRSDWQLLD